jgi:hypothetical protein
MIGVLQARKGVRVQGPRVVMNVAALPNTFNVFQVSNFVGQIGTRTFRIKRIKGLNAALANTLVHIGRGVGAGFVDMIPELNTFNGLNFDFVEADLPEVEWNVDMTAWTVAATVTIQVEVEELG